MSKLSGIVLKWTVAAASAAVLATSAWAQGFPSKRVTFVVPFAPGGPTDAVGRTIAENLADTWKQPVVVENKPGASGYLGADFVVRQPADGYALLLHGSPAVFLAKVFMKDPPVDSTQLRPVALVAEYYHFFVTHPGTGVKTLPEFIALAKKRGSAMNFAMVPGTHNELEIYAFLKNTGLDMTIIPYQSNALQAAMRGDADLFLGQYVSMWPQAQAGKLVPLAYLGPQRYRLAPNVPTAREQGSDVIMGGSFGIMVQVKTPDDIVRKIGQDIAAGLKQPAVAERLHNAGYEVPTAPLEWPNVLPQQIKTYTDIARAMNYQAK